MTADPLACADTTAGPCLRQLCDPAGYQPCDWDLRQDPADRAYWVNLFRWHLDAVLIPLIREQYPAATPACIASLRRAYLARFQEIDLAPASQPRLDVLTLTAIRNEILSRYGVPDPFIGVKQRESDAAQSLLPGLLAELDDMPHEQRRTLLIDGLLAGNIFDLGVPETVRMHNDGRTTFAGTRDALRKRPWLYDDTGAWWRHWDRGAPRHVLFFVDNAGSDIVLGCLPLARWMLAAGARVTLAANTRPALNDVTAAELCALLARCAALDEAIAAALREGSLRVAATGNELPLIDLSRLDPVFVAETADANLVILHGMGRAIESNFHAGFTCGVLRTAILKDDWVARRRGGALLDCVFRFEGAPGC